MELPGETGSRLESGTAPATVSETVRFSRTVCGLMPLHDVWEGAAKVQPLVSPETGQKRTVTLLRRATTGCESFRFSSSPTRNLWYRG